MKKDPPHKILSLKSNFEAQVTASLMIQNNALVSMKVTTYLCGISRQEIDRRIHNGTFPKPTKLSGDEKSTRKAFYLNDIQAWINNPTGYRQNQEFNTPDV